MTDQKRARAYVSSGRGRHTTRGRFRYNLWLSQSGHDAVAALAQEHGIATSEAFRRILARGLVTMRPQDWT